MKKWRQRGLPFVPKDSHFANNALGGIESLLVVVVFLVTYNMLDLRWAIGLSAVTSLWFAFSRYRRGVAIGKFLPIITLFIVARGTLGIITDSKDIYFGSGIALGALFGIVLAVSVRLDKNLLVTAAPYFFDFSAEVKVHPIYSTTLNRLAYAASIYYVAKAGFDLWLLSVSSTNQYVIVRTLISWPIGLAVFWGSVGYAARKFSKIPNWEGFMVLMERQSAVYKRAFVERFRRGSGKNKER